MPRQFSWIDQRLVRDRHIKGRTPEALSLYLFLCTVADAQGLSYYSDATASGMLGMSYDHLSAARAELVRCGLIAFRSPYYQVLSLEPQRAVPLEAEARREGEERSIGAILRSLMEES